MDSEHFNRVVAILRDMHELTRFEITEREVDEEVEVSANNISILQLKDILEGLWGERGEGLVISFPATKVVRPSGVPFRDWKCHLDSFFDCTPFHANTFDTLELLGVDIPLWFRVKHDPEFTQTIEESLTAPKEIFCMIDFETREVQLDTNPDTFFQKVNDACGLHITGMDCDEVTITIPGQGDTGGSIALVRHYI